MTAFVNSHAFHHALTYAVFACGCTGSTLQDAELEVRCLDDSVQNLYITSYVAFLLRLSGTGAVQSR